jgi:regulator of cell morphogenesis and NO signaling
MTISMNETVRDVAVQIPGATRLFEKLGIDYCCGGGKALEDACAGAGVAIDEVLSALEAIEESQVEQSESTNWQAESLSSLISYILDKHHVFTRNELARIDPLMAKVLKVYGEQRAELSQIRALFEELNRDLLAHMQKEETVLFPYISLLESARQNGRAIPKPPFQTVENPLRMMMSEHDRAGELLRSIRKLTGNFTAPEGACISYQTLYRALEDLEADLHEHIHLENNILFPRALELERAI